MGRINKVAQKRDDLISLIRTTLWNRSDDNDIDWKESEEIGREIDNIISSPEFAINTGERLSLECETDYFFVTVKNKDCIRTLFDEIEKELNNFYTNECNAEHLEDNHKIAIVFIIDSLEIRALVDKLFEERKNAYLKSVKSKINKNKRMVKIESLFILTQKTVDDRIELNNVDRFSALQEPRLYNKLNFETDKEFVSQTGYVVSVDLIELIKMYNKIGDWLYANNVRYGISEQLGVDEAIRKTLEKEGEKFWYRNNGVTILVKSNDFSLNHPNKIVFKKKDDFSVINGAQTITVSANYYYKMLAEAEASLEAGTSEGNPQSEEISPKQVIESIKKARVLLRVICIRNDDKEMQKKEGNEISVSLNRQKPIKVEDIAYTLDYISDFSSLLRNVKTANAAFSLKKRGEQAPSRGAMDLVEFSRAKLACNGEPIKARNGGAATLLKFEPADDGQLTFSNKNIFVPEINETTFSTHYNGVLFAHDISSMYKEAVKPILKKKTNKMTDEDRKYNSIVNNAKWIFISHVVESLNNGVTDYSSFNYSVDNFNLTKMLKTYFDQAYKATGKDPIDVTTFKSMTWANKMKKTIDLQKVIESGKLN